MIHGPSAHGLAFSVQQLLVYLPLVLFFAAYKFADIYVATIVLMISSSILLVVERVATGSVKKMHLYGTMLILVLGAITVAVRDPRFIQWKLTLIYWSFGIILLANHLRAKKPLVQSLIEATLAEVEEKDADSESLSLADGQWRGLNLAWAVFFVAVGALNLYVAYNFSEATWVNFKLFGVFAIQFVFLVATLWWMFSNSQSTTETNND